MTEAEMRHASEQYGKIQGSLRTLDSARKCLDALVNLGKANRTIKVGYNQDGSTRNDYYTKQISIPIAVPIQQAIYECQAIERQIIKLGGSVPPDPLQTMRSLARARGEG